jgi:hypothetical protein
MDENPPDDAAWSHCIWSCSPDIDIKEEDGCQWEPAPTCVAEFDYEGVHYTGCSAADHDSPWCSNDKVYAGSWNHCLYTCDDKKDETKAVNNATVADDMLCTWNPKPECSTPFVYKDVEYTGCSSADHPIPWCSLNSIHQGEWTLCSQVCTKAPITTTTSTTTTSTTTAITTTTSTTTTSTTTAILAASTTSQVIALATTTTEVSGPGAGSENTEEDACARHGDSENDKIGMTVTLDEAGYQTAARQDSPINMKRFICRVVDSINCRVKNYADLMGFIPHYSGVAAHQTYAHLESELKILCHAGGKWIVVRSGSDWFAGE